MFNYLASKPSRCQPERPLCYTIFVLLIRDKEKLNYLHIIFKELADS